MRDICIVDTTIADWRSAWSMLAAPDLAVKFTIDGVQKARPEDVERVFAQRLESTILLAVIVGDVQLNCHFFDELEVELDLDPRQVIGQAQFDAVVSFMRSLAAATGKPVMMTPENTHDAPFLRVVPSGSSEYISSGGLFREMGELREQHIRQRR